ncbi:hypothetical protein B0H17DRAFT_1132245 [Mycena rosella]|uniref:cutinase n=1 Tax=Mycena rosella TaxID=1033263 RepID=A0AAD7GGN5_MYCRO|nr:hypothetical protein B0H17DRAFT_1132245 [Mycena rosella]
MVLEQIPEIHEARHFEMFLTFLLFISLKPAPLGIAAGRPLQTALKTALGGKSLLFTGVDYPADIPGFLEGGDAQGSATVASDLTNAAPSCPNAALVTVGYSQGRFDLWERGDPHNGAAVAGIDAANAKIICHAGDNIRQHGDLVLPPHLTYGLDAQSAATFIARKV